MVNTWNRRVAIIGSAQTELRARWSDRQHVDLISTVVAEALLNAGITTDDVDFVIDSGSDILDGRSISNCGFLGAMAAQGKEESRVEEDGLWSALYAVMKIASGSAKVGVVLAYSKPSESSVQAYYASQTEPFFLRPVGFDHLAANGLQAQRYLADFGIEVDSLAKVVVHDWANAARNPRVALAESPTLEQVLQAPMRAAPLTALQLSQPVDGAVALVVVAEEVARQTTDAPVWITGMGTAMDQHSFALREPGSLLACEAAARTAYRRAGIEQPNSVSLVETSAGSAVGELMVLEALGFADGGHALSLFEEDHSGPLINGSGGSLPADPIMATGLVRLSEGALRLAGHVPDVTGASAAIIHAASGIGMQNHAVFVLES